jgi:flagellar basal body-associated protein FliL
MSTLPPQLTRAPPSGSRESYEDVMNTLIGILGTENIDLTPKEDVELDNSDRSLQDLTEMEIMTTSDKGLDNYQQELEKFNTLHSEIEASDNGLKQLQEALQSFQKDLSSVSTDMEALQNRSMALSKRIDRRKEVEEKLAPVVQALIIPPPIVRQITEGDVSPQWRAALKYVVKRKHELAELKNKRDPEDKEEIRAIQESESQLELVGYKAVEKIRDFITTRIKSLRVAGVNCQAIQKNLLEYRELFEFLDKENPDLGRDLCQAYLNTMRWYYGSYFGRYIKSLEKLPLHAVDKTVLLGDDGGSRRGFFSSWQNNAQSTRAAWTSTDYANVGSRMNIVQSDDPTVMVANIAESQAQGQNRYYMETPYRSLNLALVDNATVEYQFLTGFFSRPNDRTIEMFNEVFESATLAQAHRFTKSLVSDSYDAYGVLILIRLVKKLEFELQHRKIPVLEGYFNLELINLWPKLQGIMDGHCESLRRAATRSSSYSMANSSSSGGNVPNSSAAHVTTQHFASFLAGVLTLCPDDDSATEPVSNSLMRLRNDFESFLTKVSNAIGDQTARERFLKHNYTLVSTILSDITGKLAEAQQEHFNLLTDAYNE